MTAKNDFTAGKRLPAPLKRPSGPGNAELRAFVISCFEYLGENYTETAAALDVGPATIYKMVKGLQKDSPLLRRKLNLPPAMVMGKPCACGIIHGQRKKCQEGKKALQLSRSSDPVLLRHIIDNVVPFLRKKLD